MSILGTCQECLHHKDGMCNLRPRICVNYDHFVWDEMIVISKNDLEQKYVSRFALDAANARAEKAEARAERYEDALQQIHNWAKAYPLDVFPEPDFRRVREALEAAGITLDSVSASNMRHVITGIARIVEKALKGGEK